MSPKRNTRQRPRDPATEQYLEGLRLLWQQPIFGPFHWHSDIIRRLGNGCPDDAWALVNADGQIIVHPTRRAEPAEWLYALAHCLLHLALDHFPPPDADRTHRRASREWQVAADCVIARFLTTLKLGQPPMVLPELESWANGSEEQIYERFRLNGIPAAAHRLSPAGLGRSAMLSERVPSWSRSSTRPDWPGLFGEGLAQAVTQAVNVAANYASSMATEPDRLTAAQRARRWFMSNYPLLGALATSFKIIEDPTICARLQITVAAVDIELGEIYINPAAGLDDQELRFVMAHELLHVGLRHDVRARGRDFFLWNVACDFVINGWLIEMGVGDLPAIGGLYDETLKGLSAEAIYDQLVVDLRRSRKLATLRGIGLSDMLEPGRERERANGIDLDEFYRRCLAQGFLRHCEQARGLLPAGLVEAINALSQPPVPWDVELARWLDHSITPLERHPTYARLSRRQSATPDIVRPRWVPEVLTEQSRTFGVILDTSGSMKRTTLAKALGTIVSYCQAREVEAVRVVFCDARVYDEGYVMPATLAGRVRLRGRGGTILQPAIDLLERADDFPPTGPLLVITDGQCDRLHIRRDHAFLLPMGAYLPFVPRGKVFFIE